MFKKQLIYLFFYVFKIKMISPSSQAYSAKFPFSFLDLKWPKFLMAFSNEVREKYGARYEDMPYIFDALGEVVEDGVDDIPIHPIYKSH